MMAAKINGMIACTIMALHSYGYSCTNHMFLKDFNSVKTMGKDNYSLCDFWTSVITVPCGQTNAVYYAGTIDGSTILVHETSIGIRKWYLKNANVERSIIMPYTNDRCKWILLKDSGEDRFRHWDWKREIQDFIQKLPLKSALVKPISTFYRIDGALPEKGCIFVVGEFLVESTLCDTLRKGDKICTEQLYDGSEEDKLRILFRAMRDGKRIVGRRQQNTGLCFTYWDKGRIVHPKELPKETFFIIDNEIVTPFEFMWNNAYDGLVEFDEQFAQDAYIKRTMQKR